MKKGNALPESLELLLDTMCNTFGGIVFIAISLTIISQMAARNMVEHQAQIDSGKPTQEIKQELQEMEDTLKRKQQEKNHRKQEQQKGEKAEKYQFWQQITQQKQKLDKLEKQLAESGRREITSRKSLDEAKQNLKQLKQNTQAQTLKSKLQADALRSKEKILADKLKRLQQEQSKSQGRTVIFSQERRTTKNPVWVFLKEGKLYRYVHGSYSPDVSMTRTDDVLNFDLINGHPIREHAEEALKLLFSMANPRAQFITIMADDKSFQELVILRRFLRSSGFMVQWSITDRYQLFISSHVDYTAAD